MTQFFRAVDSCDDFLVGVGTKEELAPIIVDYCRESGAMPSDVKFYPASPTDVAIEARNAGKLDK